MRPLPLFCAAFAVALAAVPNAAHAAGGPPAGEACSYDTVNWDPLGEDQWTGQITGGPLVAPGSAVAIGCSVHVGNAVHSGPAAAGGAVGPSPHVAVLLPTPITFRAGPDDLVSLCTQATVDGTTWYLDGEDVWTTDPDASCRVSTTVQVGTVPDLPPPLDPVEGLVYCMFNPCIPPDPLPDVLLCPTFQSLPPGVPGVVDVHPDGDVDVAGQPFWDCPPYQG